MPTIIASEEVVIIYNSIIISSDILSPNEFDGSIQRAEQRDFNADVKALEGQLGGNGMLKCIGEVRRSVENTTVVDVGDVDLNRIIFSHGDLRGFNSDPALSSNATGCNLSHSTE